MISSRSRSRRAKAKDAEKDEDEVVGIAAGKRGGELAVKATSKAAQQANEPTGLNTSMRSQRSRSRQAGQNVENSGSSLARSRSRSRKNR